jgi:hypothetical protein
MLKRTLVAFVAVACLVSPGFAKNTKKTTPAVKASPADEFTTGEFDGCPPEGDGGDPALNYLKNSDAPITEPYTVMKIADIIADVPDALNDDGRKPRSKWDKADLDAVNEEESVPISIEGFLANAPSNPKHEGPESCNCHSDTDKDYHVWIVEDASDTRAKAVVVEISPRMLKTHADWPKALRDAKANGSRVRVSGWRTWDQEHPDQIGKTRGTLWEIHPIHKIEVADANGNFVEK